MEGDAHAGKTVKHLFLAKKAPSRKNIRQVHLIPMELLDDLNGKGFSVSPGQLGENITTQSIDLLSLPVGCKLHIGEAAIVELTALRNPCVQIENFQKGMLKEVISKDDQGKIVRKVGVMGAVTAGGSVNPDDLITVELPDPPHKNLEYIW
ncbi:MOSC domain-containing protein [Marinobacter sp. ANT_B65]|uniref:MOSC domain-containing protein n=1 Tax=Marinobacter sp. ANT_B65 TaxID=2039467 RepID=UPI00193100CE|nr:MOSC domain-containing protein [Marinobacter sp. ANT_B65]